MPLLNSFSCLGFLLELLVRPVLFYTLQSLDLGCTPRDVLRGILGCDQVLMGLISLDRTSVGPSLQLLTAVVDDSHILSSVWDGRQSVGWGCDDMST